MKAGKIIGPLMFLASMSCLTGCAISYENSPELDFSRRTTIGQELVDLQTARSMEIITEEEYDALKKEIIKGGRYDIEDADLKKARDMSLITEEEYKTLKKNRL